eukprot:Awhi_evm1s12421
MNNNALQKFYLVLSTIAKVENEIERIILARTIGNVLISGTTKVHLDSTMTATFPRI